MISIRNVEENRVNMNQYDVSGVKENAQPSKLKIIPLGGLEQIGMNITAFEYEDSIIVVDCGLAFPADDMLGIDLVIPDGMFLKVLYKFSQEF